MDQTKLHAAMAARPGFPRGLRVLLLDWDAASRSEIESQLLDCGYVPTVCADCAEAAAWLSGSECAFDVLLADVKSVTQKVAGCAAVLASGKRLPMVLMSATSSPSEVLASVRLGACDYLSKPLAATKVKSIWIWVMRRMLRPGALPGARPGQFKRVKARSAANTVPSSPAGGSAGSPAASSAGIPQLSGQGDNSAGGG
jgi:DNA-binding response OmpR family regulator